MDIILKKKSTAKIAIRSTSNFKITTGHVKRILATTARQRMYGGVAGKKGDL